MTQTSAVATENDAGGAARFALALPAGAAGQWCRLVVRAAAPGPWWVKMEARDLARGQVVREAFLGRARRGRRALLVHVPQASTQLELQLFCADGPARLVDARIAVLGRRWAALRLLLAGWRRVPRSLAGDLTGVVGRLRVELGQAPARAGEAPPYAAWLGFYDAWGMTERAALAAWPAGDAGPAIEVVVVGEGDAAASLASVAAQWRAPVRCSRVDGVAGFVRLDGAWLLVLRAREVLAPWAVAAFARAICRAPDSRAFYADVDCLNGGVRSAPLFKPRADPWLLAGGLLTQGACVFHPGVDAAAAARACSASLWGRVPFVLTQVPAVVQAAPAAARPVDETRVWPRVSIVIPTSCRSPHVLRCLRGLLARTDYPSCEILLAVSRVDAADSVQAAGLRAAASLQGVRVLDLGMASFNYAAVNNAAVLQATGALVLLLNDDVTPCAADWLKRMVEFTFDAATEVVGARLLYGNGRVQHAGVIMGLANLCEHAFRLAARDASGPHGLALADRQVSAVTAACLLVRRSCWNRLGGMDESYAVALNDVDFCLRAGASGGRIVLAAAAVLYHYEGRSLGRHYQGARARLEAIEVGRLRTRWRAVIADDPFYNPQASSEPGREFQPAFAPRLTPLCWIGGEDVDQG